MRAAVPIIGLGTVRLIPIRLRDAAEWRAVRARDSAWLGPWEATSPIGGGDVPPTFAMMVRLLRAEAKAGRALPWVIRYEGRLVGQITVSSITYGSLRSAQVGYWVASAFAGRGIAPAALALASDHCWMALGLHRMEVNIRPENARSRRVVEKLGFRCEGLRERYLHIAGVWADHLSYALTAEEAPAGLVSRLMEPSRSGEHSDTDDRTWPQVSEKGSSAS